MGPGARWCPPAPVAPQSRHAPVRRLHRHGRRRRGDAGDGQERVGGGRSMGAALPPGAATTGVRCRHRRPRSRPGSGSRPAHAAGEGTARGPCPLPTGRELERAERYLLASTESRFRWWRSARRGGRVPAPPVDDATVDALVAVGALDPDSPAVTMVRALARAAAGDVSSRAARDLEERSRPSRRRRRTRCHGGHRRGPAADRRPRGVAGCHRLGGGRVDAPRLRPALGRGAPAGALRPWRDAVLGDGRRRRLLRGLHGWWVGRAGGDEHERRLRAPPRPARFQLRAQFTGDGRRTTVVVSLPEPWGRQP